jgi:hypothetical protein
LVITRGGTNPLTPVIFAAMRLDILSPCGLLVSGKKNRDFTQSMAAKQVWSGRTAPRASVGGLNFLWRYQNSKKAG